MKKVGDSMEDVKNVEMYFYSGGCLQRIKEVLVGA